MGIKNFGVGGIDQKSNHLLRNDMDLVDGRNIMANIYGEYSKRPGTDEDTDFSGNYSDVVFIKSLKQYFYRDGNDYKVKDSSIRTPYRWSQDPTLVPTSNISLAEYLNTAIFTHEEDPIYTAKYDGNAIYMSGLPVPEVTSSASGSLFIIYFYEFIDGAGNVLFGPSLILSNKAATGTFTVSTFLDTGFYGGYIRVLAGASPVAINSTNRTITYDSISPDIVPGYKAVFKSMNGRIIVVPNIGGGITGDYHIILEVESVNTGAKTITFTADSFKDHTILFGGTPSTIVNILGNLSIRYYYSSTGSTTGYYGIIFDSDYAILDSSVATNSVSYAVGDTDVLMSDIYDITTSKLRPPKCKYVYTYGYQLVCGSVLSFWDFDNTEIRYTNNDLIMYSDLSTGDLGENFSEINRQLIGNTYDGQITGLSRVKDSLIVFKDRQVFAMDGVLIPGQYALRKIESNEIGCTSFKSILSIDGGLLFQGQDGIYGCDGYKIAKVSTPLDPFFTTINNKLTRSVMNNEFDQYLFWTNKGIVVFDYHNKKWFIWDSIDASSGITVDNKLSIRFFGPAKGVKFQTDLNDSGVEIDAYFRSSWLTVGEPGLLKKATFLRIYSFKNAGQKIYLKYFMDWSGSKVKGPFEIDMSDTNIKTIKRNLDIIQNQSFSFEFRNNVIDEDLNISGYEVNAGIIQERDKNVK